MSAGSAAAPPRGRERELPRAMHLLMYGLALIDFCVVAFGAWFWSSDGAAEPSWLREVEFEMIGVLTLAVCVLAPTTGFALRLVLRAPTQAVTKVMLLAGLALLLPLLALHLMLIASLAAMEFLG